MRKTTHTHTHTHTHTVVHAVAHMQLQHSCTAARQLLLLSQVINQMVGDALSGILAVEATLRWVVGSGHVCTRVPCVHMCVASLCACVCRRVNMWRVGLCVYSCFL